MRLPNRPLLLVVSVAVIAAIAVAGVSLSRSQAAPPVVATRTMYIPIGLAAQGHIVPLNFVDIRPQVSGIVIAVNFHEGDDVKAGQLLFTLDDTDARAQLAKAEAQGALIGAQLADARREFGRAQTLVASKFVAVSVTDTASSKVDALLAQARAAAAEASSARPTLAHARILSPIAGRAGAGAVHPGSLAQTGTAAPLVTVSQFSPVGVEFSPPELHGGSVEVTSTVGAGAVFVLRFPKQPAG